MSDRQIQNPIASPQDYLDRLYKVMPPEVTAAFLAVHALLTETEAPTKNFNTLVIFAIFLTILTPLYLNRFQSVTNKAQLVVAAASFPIWAANISTFEVTLVVPILSKEILTVLLIAWVLLTPLLIPTPPAANNAN